MDLNEYRALVRTAPCTFCGADPGEACSKVLNPRQRSLGGDVQYVHDDRCATFHETGFTRFAPGGVVTEAQVVNGYRDQFDIPMPA